MQWHSGVSLVSWLWHLLCINKIITRKNVSPKQEIYQLTCAVGTTYEPNASACAEIVSWLYQRGEVSKIEKQQLTCVADTHWQAYCCHLCKNRRTARASKNEKQKLNCVVATTPPMVVVQSILYLHLAHQGYIEITCCSSYSHACTHT